MMTLKDVKHGSLQVEIIKNMASITLTPMHQSLSGRSCDYFYICRASWEKVQVDVKTAFLNGELDEEVYVRTPRGIAGWPSRMKRLLKAMYGLKQAHKPWHPYSNGVF
jgi:Reverse transcriptase (RNA-dependent DNA polymerase)